MKKVWLSRKFSYIFEARPTTNLAFFMQSSYAHALSKLFYLMVFCFLFFSPFFCDNWNLFNMKEGIRSWVQGNWIKINLATHWFWAVVTMTLASAKNTKIQRNENNLYHSKKKKNEDSRWVSHHLQIFYLLRSSCKLMRGLGVVILNCNFSTRMAQLNNVERCLKNAGPHLNFGEFHSTLDYAGNILKGFAS